MILTLFVAGEAEVDEPLAVEQPSRFLQQRNPPPVVLDQVVVGGEDTGYAVFVKLLSGARTFTDENVLLFMIGCAAPPLSPMTTNPSGRYLFKR